MHHLGNQRDNNLGTLYLGLFIRLRQIIHTRPIFLPNTGTSVAKLPHTVSAFLAVFPFSEQAVTV
jgi:hypothetical protein